MKPSWLNQAVVRWKNFFNILTIKIYRVCDIVRSPAFLYQQTCFYSYIVKDN